MATTPAGDARMGRTRQARGRGGSHLWRVGIGNRSGGETFTSTKWEVVTMARPRTPTATLELRGAYKINPQRKRKAEPKPTSKVGEPPAHLPEAAQVVWAEMMREGSLWLTGADRLQVEIVAQLMAEFRLGDMSASKLSILVGALNKLGFGPSERSKINAPQAKEPEASPFETFN